MSLLAQGNRAKQVVPAGRVVRVSTPGSAQVQVGSNAATTLTASTQDYGPFASLTVVTIRATSKDADFGLVPRDVREVVTSSNAPTNNDGRPDGTIYIQG